MKPEQLFEAMGNIDAKWVIEANRVLSPSSTRIQRRWLRAVCAAVVICCICALVWMKQGREVLQVQRIAYAAYERRQQAPETAVPQSETMYQLEMAMQQGIPDGFGGVYLDDQGQCVILLCQDSEDIRQAWRAIAGTQAIRFETARFSQAYLEAVLERVSAKMREDDTATSVLSASLNTPDNCVDVYLRVADRQLLKALAALDPQGQGDALNVYLVEGAADGAPLAELAQEEQAALTDGRLSAQQIALDGQRGQQLSFVLQNALDGPVTYGEQPRLQMWAEGAWKQVPVLPDVAWNEIAHVLEAGQSRPIAVNLEAVYGTLLPGSYRFVKLVCDPAGQTYAVYAPFTVPVS